MARARVSRRSGRILLVSACVAGALGALGACAPGTARADGAQVVVDVVGHLDHASSALATGRLALETALGRRLPAVTADQAVADAVETAAQALRDLAALVPPAADDTATRIHEQALDATADAVRALARTRVALTRGVHDGEVTHTVLDDAQAGLDAVTSAARATVAP